MDEPGELEDCGLATGNRSAFFENYFHFETMNILTADGGTVKFSQDNRYAALTVLSQEVAQ